MSPGQERATAGTIRACPTFLGAYEWLLLAYVATLLFLYPYGISLGGEASVRPPDLLALAAVALGLAAIFVRGKIRVHGALFGVIGAFVLLELALPFVGAVGYRKPTDAVSALRMAMLWLPMVFLTMLAPGWHAARFEDRLARLLAATMWINLAYALMQVAARIGVIPHEWLVTIWLEPWAVDRNYKIIDGLRPAGFFANSTTLSVFGIICLSLFYARYVGSGQRRDLLYTLLGVALVVLSTSRTAYIASTAILLAGWLQLSGSRKSLVAAIMAVGIGALLVAVEQTVGIGVAFSRIQRLADVGLFADRSFGARFYDIWPAAIEAAREYRFGTLVQAQRVLPLIDSGYLNYYLQGRWPFMIALGVLLAGLWFHGLRAFFGRAAGRTDVIFLFLAIFLTGALVISNPLRSPLMITILVLSLWRASAERGSLLLQVRPHALVAPRSGT